MNRAILFIILFFVVGAVFSGQVFAQEAVEVDDIQYTFYRSTEWTKWTHMDINHFRGELQKAVVLMAFIGEIPNEVATGLLLEIEAGNYDTVTVAHGRRYQVLISGMYDVEQLKETAWNQADSYRVHQWTFQVGEIVYVLEQYFENCENIGLFTLKGEAPDVPEKPTSGKFIIVGISNPSYCQPVNVNCNQSVTINIQTGSTQYLVSGSGPLQIAGGHEQDIPVYCGSIQISSNRGNNITVNNASSSTSNSNSNITTGEPESGTCGDGTPWSPVRP